MSACRTCRHHTIEKRPFDVKVADAELELMEESDEQIAFFVCKHPEQVEGNRDQGYETPSVRVPGADCKLYELGKKGGKNAELERLMAAAAARAEKDERRGQ